MFEIILYNFGLWFNILVPITIAFYLAITHKEYIWKEFGIQIAATFAYMFIIYAVLFSITTNLIDNEYWNGKVSSFEYYEEWTELVTYTESYSCGKNTCTRTKTRRDHHSPYWIINTSNGEIIHISENDYLKASRKFGHTEVDIYHSNQVSINDGDKYVSIPNIIIPTSVSHSYENLVVAANHNVIHVKVPEENIKQLVENNKLHFYPEQYIGRYGELKLDRLIDISRSSQSNIIREDLDLLSDRIGKSKQANPIIYITKEGRDFKPALEQYWNKSKKNDVVLILGVDDNSTIVWSDVIAWTNNTDFLVDCSNNFEGKNIKTQPKEIVFELGNLIQNGYIRKPMKEFEYLKENITLEWYWQFFIFLGNLALSTWIFYYMMHNYERKRY